MRFFRTLFTQTEPSESNGNEPMDPLEAVPLPVEGVEARESEGVLHLRRDVQPRAKFQQFVIHRLGLNKGVRLVLDEVGSGFWGLVDGERTLREISQRVSIRFELPSDESERGVLMYTKMLMRRNFLRLKVQPPFQESPSEVQA